MTLGIELLLTIWAVVLAWAVIITVLLAWSLDR